MKGKIRSILNILIEPINIMYFRIFTFLNRKKILNKNQICKELSGDKILVLAPHIDDEIIGCGGAIIKYKKLGKEIYVCYLTKSQKRGNKASADEIAEQRRKEAYKVFRDIGIPDKNLFFLSGEDGNLINSNIENELLETIELVNPDTIFLPIFLDTHVDHYAATIKLLKLYRNNPSLLEDIQIFLYESQSPITSIYSNTILDISDVFDEKLRLLMKFKSQNLNLKSIENINRINGLAARMKACEVFINMPIDKYIEGINNSIFTSEDKYLEIRKKLKQNWDNLSLIGSYTSSLRYKKNLFS